jgi:hypothetical protein
MTSLLNSFYIYFAQQEEDNEQEEGLDWNKEMQGSMLSAFYYGFGVTQIFGGWISDRISGSKIM